MSSLTTDVNQPATKRKRLAARLIPSALVAGLVVVGLSPISPLCGLPTATAAEQNVKNGSFTTNTDGWRTNASNQTLKLVAAGHSGSGAALSMSSGKGTVVLNDVKPTVASASAGSSYTVSAWVKAKTAGVSGHLRVREVTKAKTVKHQKYFTLSNTNWTKVSFDFKNTQAGADFDLNVLGYDVASTNSLFIDDVSLVSGGGAPVAPVGPDADTPGIGAAASLNNGGTFSKLGIPSKGAYFGASVGSNTDPAAFEKEAGGNLGVRRTFYSATQVDKAVSIAKTDIANKRIPWISFKLPYSWKDMAAGKGDAWAKDLVAKLDALNGPVWLAFHHEPEGDAPIKDWVAMQKHLSPIVKKNSDNVAFTMILTGWNQLYGNAEYSLENTWPGDGLVDIVGYDVYNSQDIVKNGKTLGSTNMDESYFKQFEAFSKKHGVRWALAETGINDSASKKDPQWMKRTYDELISRGGIGMTYFNTPHNSITTWAITDSVKTKQFAEVLKTSAKIK
ncbi:hypothetical protein GCM10023166_24740 [Paeniglutamicibacter cryotolerans]